MKVKPIEHYPYTTKNIIQGSAEVPYCYVQKCWIALNGVKIPTRKEAQEYANKLDALITSNNQVRTRSHFN